MASNQHVKNTNRKRKRMDSNGGPQEKKPPIEVNSQAPRGINVAEFAEARALELHNMVAAISQADKSGRKQTCQSLPKHMRRRAVSHNVKRMPVRLRDAAKKEENAPKELQVKPKKKSRRQRRKTQNLLDEYNRRKKQNIWLESHIWHAKRMKMVNAWGYRLAEHSSDKGFRACHRAVANHCLLQDISYYCCIEIKGWRNLIKSAMSLITRKELGPTMAAVEYMNSGKEGHTMLYHPHKYPYGAIGLVSFMWRQFSSPEILNVEENNGGLLVDTKDSQLWIWSHPSCYIEALEVIQNVCENVAKAENESHFKSSQSFDIKHEEIPGQETNGNLITVSSLRFDLARLRLTGPLAHSLLVEVLELSTRPKDQSTAESVVKEKKALSQTALQQDNKVKENNNYSNSCTAALKQDVNSTALAPDDLWDSLKSVSCSSTLPHGVILGLTVLDPRLALPGKRTSIDAVVTERDNVGSHGTLTSKLLHTKWPSYLAASSLWNLDTRIKVKESKLNDQELNNLRSNLLVPGSHLDLGDKASCIPILLVQQPGNGGYGAGWDIILPSGWTMAFWIALVYRGARVGGLRESRNCSLESEVPYFPRDVPDSRTGVKYSEDTRKESENKYTRYPPDKRHNYHKLGMISPFQNPWSQLVKEWKLEAGKLEFSLQARNEQNTRAECAVTPELNNGASTMIEKRESESLREDKTKNTLLINKELKRQCDDSFSNEEDSCLDTERFYILRDVSKLRSLRHVVSHEQGKCERSSVENKLHFDSIKEIMQNNLQALIAISLRMVNKGYPLPNATVSIPTCSDLELLQRSHKYGGPVEPLHKGPKRNLSKIVLDSETMIGYCTRKLVGFVTSGQFSLSRGCGVGIAYCALPGLVQLLSQGKEGVVLIRNTTTQQYRFAYFTIL